MTQMEKDLPPSTQRRMRAPSEKKDESMGAAAMSVHSLPRDDLTYSIIGAAMSVHSELGPGLFEGVYENALCVEFKKRDINYQRQRRYQIQYAGEDVGDMIADLVVEDKVIVELKSVQELLPVHEAQIIAYLRAAKMKTGLLINFNVRSLKSGIRRISV